MLPCYLNYIFVHQRQKARFMPKIFVNFRPELEPDPKSPAGLTNSEETGKDLNNFCTAISSVFNGFL